LILDNPTDRPRKVWLRTSLQTANPEPARLTMSSSLINVSLEVSGTPKEICEPLLLPPGRSSIRLACDASPLRKEGYPQNLVFRLLDFEIVEDGLRARHGSTSPPRRLPTENSLAPKPAGIPADRGHRPG
jgi:hypothetical protein